VAQRSAGNLVVSDGADMVLLDEAQAPVSAIGFGLVHALRGLPGGGFVATGRAQGALGVAAYTAGGVEIWRRCAGGDGSNNVRVPPDEGRALALLPDGAIAVTGVVSGQVQLGATEPVVLDTGYIGKSAPFVAVYTGAGSLRWARLIDDVSRVAGGSSMATLADGGLLVAGYNSVQQVFWAKLDADGNEMWRQLGTADRWLNVAAVVALPDGGAALVGTVDGVASLGADPATALRIEPAVPAWYVARIELDGTARWVRLQEVGRGFDLAVLGDGTLVAAGQLGLAASDAPSTR
jgi:hypothetical protein